MDTHSLVLGSWNWVVGLVGTMPCVPLLKPCMDICLHSQASVSCRETELWTYQPQVCACLLAL